MVVRHPSFSYEMLPCCCCCHDEPVRRCLYGVTDVPKRWGIPPDSHSPGTHLWCQSNHRSNAGVLLPILGRATVNVNNNNNLICIAPACRMTSEALKAVSSPLPQCGQVGDSIWPIKCLVGSHGAETLPAVWSHSVTCHPTQVNLDESERHGQRKWSVRLGLIEVK